MREVNKLNEEIELPTRELIAEFFSFLLTSDAIAYYLTLLMDEPVVPAVFTHLT